MRIALLQLPIPDPNYLTTRGNVPLASGSLASWLRLYCSDRVREASSDIVIAPRDLMDFGGDEALISWVVGNGFDIAGFTCYMWNVERSIWLSQRIKERSGDIFIIFGGPEITPDSPWLEESSVDFFISGEGEEAFASLVDSIACGKKPERVVIAPRLRQPEKMPNPYVSGALSIRCDEPVPLETARGCPFGCTYCYYSKAGRSVRNLSDGVVRDFFGTAAKKGASEVYIMDPSFCSSHFFSKKLESIRSVNTTRIPIHAEVNLELVGPEEAALLSEAGIASVEAGLQSVNRSALRAVRRYFDRDRFLRGAELLARVGIAITTGIILGLPRDTIDGFSKTCDFVSEHSLVQHSTSLSAGRARVTEIYPLSVLPGTRLKHEARRFGIEHMESPPYWVLESDTFTAADFTEARDIAADKLGLELFQDVMPHFGGRGGFTGCIDARSGARPESTCKPETLSNNCTIIIDRSSIGSSLLGELARTFRDSNPFACIKLVMVSDEDVPDEELVLASDMFFRPMHYAERLHTFDDDNQGRFGTRIFQLVKDPARMKLLAETCPFADPVFLYEQGRLDKTEPFLIEEGPIIVVPKNISGEEREAIERIYALHPEHVIPDEWGIITT